jgi:hypothetical protein
LKGRVAGSVRDLFLRMNSKVILFLLMPVWAFGQVRLKASDPLIRYDLIRPGHYYSKFTAFDTAGRVLSVWLAEHVTEVDTIRKEFLFVRFVPYGVGRFVIDSCWNDGHGPVRYVLVNYPVTRMEADVFRPERADVHANRRGVVKDTAVMMEDGYMDDTSIWEMWGYMDLRKDVKYEMNVFGSDVLTPLTYRVEYLMDDYLQEVDGGWVRCKVIQVQYGSNDWRLWIDPRTHETIRAVMKNEKETLVETVI